MGAYSNQEALEGTVTTTVTLTLARPSRAIEIINDSGTRDLEYKFGASATFATLKPLEVVSMELWIRQIILNSPRAAAVPYRIRILG